MDSPAAIAAVVFAKEGYVPTAQSPLISQLEEIEPFGDTAMLQSMVACINRILRVNSVLSQLGLQNAFNFLHIVITDGVDNQSNIPLEKAAAVLMLVGRTIPVDRCKTVIIGIDLDEDPRCRAQLDLLDQIGGENCEKYDIDSVQIGQVFDHIRVSLGIQRQVSMSVASTPAGTGLMLQQTARPVLSIQKRNFAVLFDLDISGSMAGKRWERVKTSVKNFMGGLGESDLVSAVCFNGEVMSVDYAVRSSKANQSQPQGRVILVNSEACSVF